MSLEKKLSGFLDRFKVSFSRSGAAYSLAVGLALSVPFYGCAPKDEGEDENTIQRYSCSMNQCAPDPYGPYAVADCNNECEEDGKGQPMDYLTATNDGVPICPLGWSEALQAQAAGSEIYVGGICSSIDAIDMYFKPTPLPGGSAPCILIRYGNANPTDCRDVISGQATVTGSTGAFRVSGSCSCGPYSAEFSLPLRV